MTEPNVHPTRRDFLAATLALTASAGAVAAPTDDRALIAITLDLEMSRNFPTWGDTHWDYEKGNLDDATKRYAVEAARRVKGLGGRIHFFALGRTMEQENVDWLRTIIAEGHPVGNHTYDHVNVLATKSEDLQFRFRRAPWLIAGKTPAEVIAENIKLASAAIKERVGIVPDGFRTPGGFADGLAQRPDLQELLKGLGYTWVSSKYPPHPGVVPDKPPTQEVLAGIRDVQSRAQPFVYPSGLVEVPMNPISDIGAFRTGRWPLESFLEAIRVGVTWAIEHRAVYDFLGHPSCLVVTDPEFRVIELICKMVREAGDRAAIVSLGTIAQRVRARGG